MTILHKTIKISLACLSLSILTACNGGGGDSNSTASSDNTAAIINTRPVAIAGQNLTVAENTLVTLDASNSYDPEGAELIFQWRQISGEAVTLSSETDDTPSFISPNGDNILTFQLVVDDGQNLSIADTVTVTIIPESITPPETGTGTENNNTGDDNGSDDASNTDDSDTTSPPDDSDEPDNTNNEDSDNTNENNEDQSSDEQNTDEEDSDENQTDPVTTNTAPTANAGDDKHVDGFSLVILDGSLSTDPENNTLSYFWQQTSGTPVILNNTEIASPNFTAPNTNDTLTFSLTVSDTELSSETDEVNITITQVNTSPTANAGQDKTATGLSQVTLEGASSSDPEGDNLSYEWLQISGPTVSLTNNQTANPSFTAPNLDTTLSFSLVVSDGEFQSSPDTVNITISKTNTAPIADAGLSQTVLGFSEINLDGSLSTDPESDELTFFWEQTAGTEVTLNNPDTAFPSFFAPNMDETLTFSLIVNDGELSSAVDTISITIEKINSIPIAHAGVDRYVGSLSVVALNGTLSTDPDDDPLSYTWTQLSGPSVQLSNPNSSKPTFTADTDGQLIFSLVVNDGQNSSEADTIKVVVGPIPATNIKVNGTGITWGGSYPSGNNAGCIGEAIDQQDCSLGRELTHNDDTDGRVGFSFTKINSNGVDVGHDASEWQCVQDSVTGLMWEIKSGGNGVIGDEGINDADDRYSWYNSDPASNGGGDGFMDNQGEICSDYDAENPQSHCNTQAFVERMNKHAWCGFADWRLPTRKELLSIVDYGNARPMIDSTYFPEVGHFIWTSTPLALGSTSAWGVNFDYGNSFSIDKRNARQVRLVRGGYE